VAQPRISDSRDFYALSRRYPELLLLLDHRQGGGGREWAIKGRRDCPNVCVDTSGSVLEDDAIERAVRTLGPWRLLFATDITMEGGVGEIFSAERTAEEREDIFWRNLHGLLGGGAHDHR
jgi:predicted TIM-barrel fold metal-dependent hydrolase